MEAAMNGRVPCVEALVAHGADVEAKSNVSAIQQHTHAHLCFSNADGVCRHMTCMLVYAFYMYACVPAALHMSLCIYRKCHTCRRQFFFHFPDFSAALDRTLMI